MASSGSGRGSLSPRAAHVLLALFAVIGLADAIYLTHVKWSFRANPSFDGGMCGLGGGCDQLQHSALAEIPLGDGPGIPISLLGVGFYVAFLVLLVLRVRALRKDPTAEAARAPRRLQLGLAVLANLYSAVLLGYSLSVGQFCPFCGVLYGVNLALLVVALLSLGEPLGTFVKAAFRAVGTRAAGIAFAVFALTVGGGFAVYSATLPPPPKFTDPLADPALPHRVFDVAGRAARGSERAPIHIVEFADFECPHCRVLYHTLESVLATRGEHVLLNFLHFPLDKACNRAVPVEFHPRACELAVLGECANRQGRFFDVAGVLFDEGTKTAHDALVDKIAGLGLDRAQLDACLADPEAVAAVKRDIEAGLAAGVDGTPALYVNGVEAGGARPREFFEQLIDKHLGDRPSVAPGGATKPDGAAQNP